MSEIRTCNTCINKGKSNSELPCIECKNPKNPTDWSPDSEEPSCGNCKHSHIISEQHPCNNCTKACDPLLDHWKWDEEYADG